MKKIADYELLERLGEGNQGVFYLARTPDRLGVDDAFCAVKVLGDQASKDAFRRMSNELRLFASVRSPHLVRLYDAGQQRGVLYYATAYHQLGSLAAPRNSARSLERRVAAVADAARGAHALHEVGVAHRDIKPSNVLLSESAAVLSDLGLTQVLSPGTTMTGFGPIGSIAYMEPGIAHGDPASRTSDVWSLAATLLTAVSGEQPFPDLPTANLLQALDHIGRQSPRIPDGLPTGLRVIIARGLDADRRKRPQSAQEFAEELDEVRLDA